MNDAHPEGGQQSAQSPRGAPESAGHTSGSAAGEPVGRAASEGPNNLPGDPPSQSARPRYESFVDRQVREAIERGEFDNLPGAGRPIPGLGGRHDPDWWIKRKLADEDLRSALPPPLALRREREEILRTLADVIDEDAARAIVDDLNARILAANSRQVTRVPIITRRVNVEEVLEQWRRTRRPR